MPRRDQRSALLRSIVREFPETQAGKRAGLLERYHAIDATPQRIRMSRGFLLENPMVAESEGMSRSPNPEALKMIMKGIKLS